MGWGATLGDHFIQGKWSGQGCLEGINCKELGLLARALEMWRVALKGKWILAQIGGGSIRQFRRLPLAVPDHLGPAYKGI